jgi:hypothetical protein
MSQSDNNAPKRTQRPRRINSSPSPSPSPAPSDHEPDPAPSPAPLSVDAFLRARAKPPLKKYRKRRSTLAHTTSPPPPPRRTHRSVRRRDDDPSATAFVRQPHAHPDNDAPPRSTMTPPRADRRRAAAPSRLPTSLADWKIGPVSPPPQTSPLKASRSRRGAGGPPPLAFVPLDEHAQTYSHFRSTSSLQ